MSRGFQVDDNQSIVFIYSTYETILKTIDEIGLLFSKQGDCYIGQITLYKKPSNRNSRDGK